MQPAPSRIQNAFCPFQQIQSLLFVPVEEINVNPIFRQPVAAAPVLLNRLPISGRYRNTLPSNESGQGCGKMPRPCPDLNYNALLLVLPVSPADQLHRCIGICNQVRIGAHPVSSQNGICFPLSCCHTDPLGDSLKNSFGNGNTDGAFS